MRRMILGDGKVSKIIRREGDIVVSHSQLNIENHDDVIQKIRETDCDVVINAIAKTNLEWCQENKTECFDVNTSGVLSVIEACALSKKKLVHISSGCLFDGNHEVITEYSNPTPAVWYTWTKLWADQIIQNFGYSDYLILRPRQLVSSFPHPTNLLTKFSRMKSISAIDEPNSLTCIEDFSEMIDHLLSIDANGTFNCANSGVVSPYWIAKRLQETISPDLKVEKIEYEEFLKTLKNKRVNTILSTDKIENTGYKNREAVDAVNWCLENYKK